MANNMAIRRHLTIVLGLLGLVALAAIAVTPEHLHSGTFSSSCGICQVRQVQLLAPADAFDATPSRVLAGTVANPELLSAHSPAIRTLPARAPPAVV